MKKVDLFMTINNRIKRKIKEITWKFIKVSFHNHIAEEPVLVRNINYKSIPTQKKVLVSYLTTGYFINPEENYGRTTILEIFKIVNVFSELGYSIDLVNCNDVKSLELIRDTKYDVIFGFGEVFFQMSEIHHEVLTVLYMTEQHPEFSIKEEQKRVDYFYFRHHKHVPIVRSGKFYKLEHFKKKYDYIITLSEVEPLKLQYDFPFTLFPTGIINPNFTFKKKQHNYTRQHFLWLGSTGVIHKGLDLLIDIFRNREDISLHICGLDEVSRKILPIPKRDNIFDYGYIDIKSEDFFNITNLCTYSILPSCAEGCATSITTSMLHGLIPVVMRNAGFNRLGSYAIFLDDYRVEYLDEFVTKLSGKDPEMLAQFSNKVYHFARKEFVLTTFEENFRNIIKATTKAND